MAYYNTEYEGMIGVVQAVNKPSADVQMEWLIRNRSCFCATCCDVYQKDYLVHIAHNSKDDICKINNVRLL